MSVIVIEGPAAVVTAPEAKASGVFSADDDNALVDMLLAAAQGTIDGPDGWLGRAIGLQTLEAISPAFDQQRWLRGPARLPYPPVRKIVSVTAGADAATLDPAAYTVADGRVTFVTAPPWDYPVRVRYVAGYGTVDAVDLPTPAPIKHAIMLMAAQLKSVSSTEGQVAREDVVGVGTTVYSVSKASEDLMLRTAENLLSTFRKFC